MSIQIERQNTHAFLASVSCLRCDAPMTIKTIEPSMSAPSHDEIVYRCPACQLERKQSVISAAVLVFPKVFEPIRRHLGVSHRVHDVFMAHVVL
jgi:hypothetical protein